MTDTRSAPEQAAKLALGSAEVFWRFQPFSIKFEQEEAYRFWDAVDWLMRRKSPVSETARTYEQGLEDAAKVAENISLTDHDGYRKGIARAIRALKNAALQKIAKPDETISALARHWAAVDLEVAAAKGWPTDCIHLAREVLRCHERPR